MESKLLKYRTPTQMFEEKYKNKMAAIYDLIHENKDYKSEVDFLDHIYSRINPKNKEVLDIGCGTGKHLEVFKEYGYNINGVDPSEDMINEAKKRLGMDVNLICGSADDVEGKFNLVVSMFNVVNHITGEYENLENFFKSASKKLNKKGLFIFDCFNRSAYVKDAPHKVTKKLINGATLTVKPKTDYYESTLDLECKYENNSEEFYYEINHKIWHINTIIVALLKSGLSPTSIYKHFKCEDATTKDYKVVFVCKKVKAIR
jgi:2-polyprenyl-3-methyl-5-hydroxy-6-metoxy-1,4-benzoquinol methylase